MAAAVKDEQRSRRPKRRALFLYVEPEFRARIERAAAARGTPVATTALWFLSRELERWEGLSLDQRVAS